MRIKKLEIHGFKSFAERAQLIFGDGITGVVGPNGCGKSNVVDALRWCMGEMSAKHLRGRAMQDVIFSGSDSRGPMGMAEVTITFRNDGNVPPQYAAYSEIAVTRRLHRDGTSEYLVNKVPARLRDITDLFLGTGVGTRAYSIIEQGRIGFIVSAKPEDRRSLIEEVAGITKFKARKKAAERRMESTHQNLLRVNDVVSELDRQLGSLRRQARKAERYRELKAELRDLELHAASLEHLRLTAVEKVQRLERERLEQRMSDAQGSVVAHEAGLEAERLRLLEIERELQHDQKVSAEMDAKLAALERDLTHWRTQLAEAGQRATTAARDVEEANQRIAEVRAERAQLEATLAQLEVSAQADAGRTEMAEVQVTEVQQQLQALDREMETLRRDAIEHIHGAAQQRSQLAALDRRRVELRNRVEQASAEQADVALRRSEAEHRRNDLSKRHAETQEQMTGWRERLQVLRQQLEAAFADVGQSEARVHALRDELGERRSRLASLEEIARRFEGYSDGVRSLMGGDGDGDAAAAVPGILALVTDVIEAAPEYERAIEAALGERLQYLVVDGHVAAQQAIEHLKSTSGGRSGFVPVGAHVEPPSPPAARPGVRGAALGFVTFKPEYAAVAQVLLGDVVIVDSMEAAVASWSAGDTAHTCVTVDGEVLDAAGVLSGGSGEGTGLLAKRREIRELTDTVASLESQLAAAREEYQRLEALRLQLEVSIQQLEKDLHAAQIELVELGKDLEAASLEVRRLTERAEVIDYELEQQRDELARLEEEEREAREAAQSAEAKHKGVETRIAQLQERRGLQAEELAARSEELTRLKVEVATRGEKLTATRHGAERLRFGEAELAARVQRDLNAIRDGEALGAELHDRIDKGAELAARTAVEAQALRDKLSEVRARYEEDRAKIGEAEQRTREQRRAGEACQEALTQIKMDMQRLELERQRLIEQVAERHDVDLLLVLHDYHLRPLPGPEEIERRQELERSIKAMGPINLAAIDECAEIEQRYGFLTKQRDDLAEALETLKRAIQRINRASRERFKEAYDAVNEMFQQVYPRLFRGGEARLELTNSEDLLEAGIEIVAQPPGKKLQSVNLMSGGEKALTATALVFAIFLIKPSPFCVLDEVDAPLDEANVGRFNEMLREISKISQFIVITHNKNTMSRADRLYGITMEEPGMSKVVSVDLEDRREEAA